MTSDKLNVLNEKSIEERLDKRINLNFHKVLKIKKDKSSIHIFGNE